MSSQSCEIHNVVIVGLPFISLRKNNHFNVVPMGRSKLYYKEEGGSFPMSKLCECNESKTNLWRKIDSIFTHHLHRLACSNDLFMRCFWTWHIVLIGILKLSRIPLSLMCSNRECAPSSFSFHLFFVVAIQRFIS
jgi:hypothetical protein